VAAEAVKSLATRRFWRLFRELPEDAQRLAIKNYDLWRGNPSHPSLHFRRLQGSADLVTVRIGDHYRALGMQEPSTVTWVWIGTHAEYDRMTRG
jgi:hypothetical protein